MTNEKAARILDSETSLEVYAETEYYGGFAGSERWKEDVNKACIMGANALREQDKQQSKWISVKDELPNKDIRILTVLLSSNGNVGIDDCFYSGMRNKFLLYNTLEEVPNEITVTHWMPMPEPPKVD